jgi:putative ABC transport system ATP-binding protein
MSAILDANNLHKSYNLGEVEVPALRGVDLSVQEGEFIAIMGPSGSGKSTLLHLLGGLDIPSKGEVILEGKSLNGLKDSQLAMIRRKKIGFIFQFFNLLPTLTAAENIYLPFLLDNKRGQQHDDKVQQMLSMVGLGDRAHHLPNQLSGGEQQRVAIARALVIEPRIILADEPTGNLDSAAAKVVLKLLQESSVQQKQTILMVTHDQKAAGYADKILDLQDGRIMGK